MTRRDITATEDLSDGHETSDLEVVSLGVRYGGVVAVDDVSLRVGHGQIVAILGANGAGKSSMLTAIAGCCPGTRSGSINYLGKGVGGLRGDRIARRGMVLVPEGRHVFAPLAVEDNLLVGAYRLRSRQRIKRLLGEVYELFPMLAEKRAVPAGLLSGGQQQMLAFGRALMSEPKTILMDEPSMGLAPIMVDRVMGAIRQMNARGASILLVEQNATAALKIASYAYVLERGRIVRHADATSLVHDPAVADAFLGLGEVDIEIAPQGP